MSCVNSATHPNSRAATTYAEKASVPMYELINAMSAASSMVVNTDVMASGVNGHAPRMKSSRS